MIGIYGGTFDPVHYGHLRTALEVKEQFDLQELRLLPSRIPPHRAQPGAATGQRFAMLKLALAGGRDGLLIDTRELQREGPSYMVETLASIRREIAQQPLLLFIGSDAFEHLNTWFQWSRLFEFAHIVVMTRPGAVKQSLPIELTQKLTATQALLKQQPCGKLFFQIVTQLDISASQIRSIFAAHRRADFLLPDNVINYILRNDLYQ